MSFPASARHKCQEREPAADLDDAAPRPIGAKLRRQTIQCAPALRQWSGNLALDRFSDGYQLSRQVAHIGVGECCRVVPLATSLG